MDINLLSVYDHPALNTAGFLYDLLAERTKLQSISHKAMPTLEQHVSFIMSRPYGDDWYLVHVRDVGLVGAVYLTSQREIGVSILCAHRFYGYGTAAVRALMAAHPGGQFLANINPANAASIAMFAKLGFHHIQNTYAHE